MWAAIRNNDSEIARGIDTGKILVEVTVLLFMESSLDKIVVVIKAVSLFLIFGLKKCAIKKSNEGIKIKKL